MQCLLLCFRRGISSRLPGAALKASSRVPPVKVTTQRMPPTSSFLMRQRQRKCQQGRSSDPLMGCVLILQDLLSFQGSLCCFLSR